MTFLSGPGNPFEINDSDKVVVGNVCQDAGMIVLKRMDFGSESEEFISNDVGSYVLTSARAFA